VSIAHRLRRLAAQGFQRALQVESHSEQRNRLDDQALRMVMAATLRTSSSCVDVGANDGTILQEMLRLAPAGRHVAFEPLADHVMRLCAKFPSVDVRNLALGDHEDEVPFIRRREPALSSLAVGPAGTNPEAWNATADCVTVRLATLDAQLEDAAAPALIKIDVEGSECAVLQGALATLTRHRPVVAIEHGLGATHHGYQAGGIYQPLSEAGLRIFDADGAGPYSHDQLIESVLTSRMWFYFAFPIDH
jgi:FkbM family methyltransferase